MGEAVTLQGTIGGSSCDPGGNWGKQLHCEGQLEVAVVARGI